MKFAVAALLAAGLAGCQNIPADAPRATATLQPTKGNKAAGTVNIYQVGSNVRVVSNVSGHADPDDYKTQPTGNAGARLACAVIQRG